MSGRSCASHPTRESSERGTASSESEPHRCGYVALAGRPNVGKSTLLNALVDEHLSIVSAKAQTTRERVNGLLSASGYQVLFIDAPGLIEPRYKLQEAMRWAADAAIEEADVVAFVVDASRPVTAPDAALRQALLARAAPALVALNKCEIVQDAALESLQRELTDAGIESLPLSAATGAGLSEFLDRVVSLLPESPPLYPTDHAATQSVRFFAAEYVRETCMELFREEVPYSIACRVDEFRESSDPVYVRITIFVERNSQKGIVIGRGGRSIRRIGETSRAKIERLIARQVYLELRVKVLAGWSRKPSRLRQLGFKVPASAGGGQTGRRTLDK